MYATSPLRYPGAKWRLERFVTSLLEDNGLGGGHYAEPFAGGSSLALSLLLSGKVHEIHLNDLDRSIWAFWRCVLEHPKELVARIKATPITIDEWQRQRSIQERKSESAIFDLGFSTFFLNRTNRSGILRAGVIGGKAQAGPWRLDARFNRDDLAARVNRIAAFRSQIHLTKLDARVFVRRRAATLPARSLMYLDPPYFNKGQELYMNALTPVDHGELADVVKEQVDIPWVVSYDDVPEIREFYRGCRQVRYELRYSASTTRKGQEVIFLGRGLRSRPSLLTDA